jgi:hypothetical protein
MIDVADLDVIFLSYKEPNKEHNWIDLKSKCPWAKRVDGVEGSDAAHKAAGQTSTTERFILIDGDNIVDPALFDQQIDLNDHLRAVFKNHPTRRSRGFFVNPKFFVGAQDVKQRDRVARCVVVLSN